jgi:lipid-A-disaccharide synthase
MRYYIIAGERSGDLHGGNLAKAIRKNDPDAVMRGFGGDYMAEAGVSITVHYHEMAVMGFGEVLRSMGRFIGFIKKCKQDILEFKPDVIILIDYAGFNRQIARISKKLNQKVFYYITPKVWAWHRRRANALKANVDHMFVILPFEKSFYKSYNNWDVDYVGNPVLDAVKSHRADLEFLKRNNIDNSKPIVALLPGSRKQELLNVGPVLADVVKKFPGYQFLVASIKDLPDNLYTPLTQFSNVKLIVEDTYNLLLHARAAIVTSGTATLETGLFKVPQVVVYKGNPISIWVARLVVKVEFISLVNLIAGREVIKELIQEKANAEEISNELTNLVTNESYRTKILNDYNEVYRTLDTGSASENTARLMMEYLKK